MLSFLPCEAFTVCVELFITVITVFIWNTNHVKVGLDNIKKMHIDKKEIHIDRYR